MMMAGIINQGPLSNYIDIYIYIYLYRTSIYIILVKYISHYDVYINCTFIYLYEYKDINNYRPQSGFVLDIN